MINLELYPILWDNRESLRETSKDDSDPNDIQYMTSSETEVVNFDLVKRHYANGFGLSDVLTSIGVSNANAYATCLLLSNNSLEAVYGECGPKKTLILPSLIPLQFSYNEIFSLNPYCQDSSDGLPIQITSSMKPYVYPLHLQPLK